MTTKESPTMRNQTFILLCTIFLLSACSPSDNQPAPKLFQDQIEVLNKAKTVEGTVQNLDAEQKKAIEQQSQ
jgi:ABC-type uncharacterized transport system auxiliary subunit